MLIRFLPLLLLFTSSFLFSQYRMDVRNVADCYGNSFIDHPGDYEFQFTGRTGTETDFSSYSSLSKIEMVNTFWASFVAPHDGLFLFSGITEGGAMNILLFSGEKGLEEVAMRLLIKALIYVTILIQEQQSLKEL